MYKKLFNAVALLLLTYSCLATAWATVDDKATKKIQPVDAIIAVVNESIITESELQKYFKIYRQQLSQRPTSLSTNKILRKQLIEQLIKNELQLQIAKHYDVEIDDDEVDQSLQKIATTSGLTIYELKSKVSEQDFTFKDYKDHIANELLIGKLQQQSVAKRVNITSEEVDKFTKDFRKANEINREYSLKSIIVPLPEAPAPEQLQASKKLATKILKTLRATAEFSAEEASKISGDIDLRENDLGWRKLTAMPEIYASRIAKLKPGNIVGPIRAPNGYHLLKLVSVREGEGNSAALTKERARQMLFARKFTEEADRWVTQLYNQSYIKVMD